MCTFTVSFTIFFISFKLNFSSFLHSSDLFESKIIPIHTAIVCLLLFCLNVCKTLQILIFLTNSLHVKWFLLFSFAQFYILVVFCCSVSFFPIESHSFQAAVAECPHRDQ